MKSFTVISQGSAHLVCQTIILPKQVNLIVASELQFGQIGCRLYQEYEHTSITLGLQIYTFTRDTLT